MGKTARHLRIQGCPCAPPGRRSASDLSQRGGAVDRWYRAAPFVAFKAAAFLAFMPHSVDGQSVVEVSDELACPQCVIEVTHVLRLGGEQDTIGIGYTGQLPIDSRGRVYFYPYEWPGVITVFAPDGSVLTTIGQRGEGPGEFRGVTGVYIGRGDTISAFDTGLQRLTVYSPQYELLRTSRVEVAATGDAFFHPAGRLVVASIGRGMGTFGYPLHILDATGRLLQSFGGDYSTVSQRNQLLLRRRIARANQGGTWAAHAFNYDIEYYDADGKLVRTLRRRPPWFPEVHSVPYRPLAPSDDPPYAMVNGIQEDAEGRLWVLSWVAATDWRRALAAQRPRSATNTGFWDTVIELIDPTSARVLARTIVPDRALGFSARRMFYTYNDEELYPRIDVWHVRLIRNPQHGGASWLPQQHSFRSSWSRPVLWPFAAQTLHRRRQALR